MDGMQPVTTEGYVTWRFFLHHQHLAFSPTTGQKYGQEQKIASCFVSQPAATASQNKHNQDKDDNTNIASRHATN